ncbi:uncharacterized protein SPSK_09454 [Sporothrix schenckii 1099-18]|uniref:Uncharacterized protein n=2 Tax=Sporothrix schenckii TaxID=29908 RepID=U7PZ41_SPOS1|nr:uncharacterized protein SPSK_09454 [Sporothrix schenckii 1099-18]ERS99984.1 hypothetical protein HMPREF1624_03354 [Sporothrix schenckii ATCC 58251]KJR85592.1 hypothetical protein SPSK_09454 [Sporothrix schenckii 1099-18]
MDIQLPPEFPQSAVDQFDLLREQGLLFYFPTDGEVVQHNGFNFEFKTSPSIARKPILAADAPERRGKGGPFVDPDPAFVVARPGPDHVVELSMHAMIRPHYVLHTRLFAPQTDDLDAGDWAATWAVMAAIRDRGHQPPMMIYNCGYEGGASQGHKHVQVFTEPDPGFTLFPVEALALAEKASGNKTTTASRENAPIVQHPTVPFQHFVQRLTGPITPDYILAVYQRLLAEVRRAHKEHVERKLVQATNGTNGTNGTNRANGTNGNKTHKKSASGTPGHSTPALDDLPESATANNVIMTPEWMCMIPRRRGGKDGTGAGSLGMLGMLWLKNAKERAHWEELGMTEHYVWMGLPRYDLK